VTICVPEADGGQVVLRSNGEESTGTLQVGEVVADELHPVSNPVVDDKGNVFVTYSGTRGEKVPFSVFMVTPDGSKQSFLGDIINPTGLAIGPDDHLYISSRHSGTIFRSSFDKQVEKYVDGLGIASGIAFDPEGNLFVGDRSGIIYKASPDQDVSMFCELEPSVSAYHLAFGPDGMLYVTGPTLATQDSIYQISRDGTVDVFFKGFGRPQGLVFDPEGNLQVTGSYKGRKGVYTFKGQVPELSIASPMLVGLAYWHPQKVLYLVDNATLYRMVL
jgi:sugar lactone lactonase YvrE